MDDWEDYMSRRDEGAGLIVLLAGAVCGFVTALVVWLLVWGFSATGPNCPGMDPEWLGWCEAADTE